MNTFVFSWLASAGCIGALYLLSCLRNRLRIAKRRKKRRVFASYEQIAALQVLKKARDRAMLMGVSGGQLSELAALMAELMTARKNKREVGQRIDRIRGALVVAGCYDADLDFLLSEAVNEL